MTRSERNLACFPPSAGPQGLRRHGRGVTLIELMIALVVLAVLIGIGVPTFRDAALGSRLSAAANDLLASVQLARSEAIKRNATVRLCVSTNGSSCAGTDDWEQGWIVYGLGVDPLDASDDEVISVHGTIPGGLRIIEASGTGLLSFQPIGIGATPAAFNVCRPAPLGSQERLLRVTASGSTSVTATYNSTCEE